MDVLLEILKLVGLVVTGVTGLIGFYTPKIWEEYQVPQTVYAPGRMPETQKRLTNWGKRSLILLLVSGAVTLTAHVVESVRAREKDAQAAKEKEEEQKRASKEKETERERFVTEKEEDRKIFEHRLGEERARYEASTAEFILLKNDLERQKLQIDEAVRARKAEPNITAPLEPLPSSPAIEAAFQQSLTAIPQAVKESAILRNKEAIERLPFELKAREVEQKTRPHWARVVDFYRNTLAMAHKKGLVTITDLGPAPVLPEQIVFWSKATNYVSSIREDIAQTVQFAHGDRWHAYLAYGVVESPEETNSAWYPKLYYKDAYSTVGIIWYDPAVGDLVYSSGWRGGSATSTVAIATNIVKDLETSRIKALKR